jgi:hypothetical protein
MVCVRVNKTLKATNKNMHSDKIKLRSFLTTLYFAGDVKRYVQEGIPWNIKKAMW